ncbi:MAG: carboxymuconolactone decarboxylase family protein [Planctomycetes bacterium]|nr:carboxymuconolactone decarboxylase family protein [Planctomycetota bacterium]
MTSRIFILTTGIALVFFTSFSSQTSAKDGSAKKGSGTRTGYSVQATPPAGLEEVYSFYKETFGFVPNLTKVMANSPALTLSYVALQKNLKEHATLNQAEINIVQLAIAVENKCTYCTAGHTMAGKMFFKTPDEHMQAVRGRKSLSDAKLQALRNFAVSVYQGQGHPTKKYVDEFYKAGYTNAQALDVVACIAAKVMTNYANALGGTELDEPLKPLAVGLNFDNR